MSGSMKVLEHLKGWEEWMVKLRVDDRMVLVGCLWEGEMAVNTKAQDFAVHRD
jgi:hypothetical protein